MDRVLACFATTAEDVAAMVCGSFSSMVPQASERWQRPAVKALVRTIHQELCDPELLGRLAPVCKELGAACVDEATTPGCTGAAPYRLTVAMASPFSFSYKQRGCHVPLAGCTPASQPLAPAISAATTASDFSLQGSASFAVAGKKPSAAQSTAHQPRTFTAASKRLNAVYTELMGLADAGRDFTEQVHISSDEEPDDDGVARGKKKPLEIENRAYGSKCCRLTDLPDIDWLCMGEVTRPGKMVGGLRYNAGRDSEEDLMRIVFPVEAWVEPVRGATWQSPTCKVYLLINTVRFNGLTGAPPPNGWGGGPIAAQKSPSSRQFAAGTALPPTPTAAAFQNHKLLQENARRLGGYRR